MEVQQKTEELPCDPAVSTLGMCLEKTLIQKGKKVNLQNISAAHIAQHQKNKQLN